MLAQRTRPWPRSRRLPPPSIMLITRKWPAKLRRDIAASVTRIATRNERSNDEKKRKRGRVRRRRRACGRKRRSAIGSVERSGSGRRSARTGIETDIEAPRGQRSTSVAGERKNVGPQRGPQRKHRHRTWKRIGPQKEASDLRLRLYVHHYLSLYSMH